MDRKTEILEHELSLLHNQEICLVRKGFGTQSDCWYGVLTVFDKNYPVEHQQGNTECGMYSLFFIIHMLEDKLTTKYLKSHIFDDKYIEKFRNVYFNTDL